MNVVEVNDDAFERILEAVDEKNGSTAGFILKNRESLVVFGPSKVNVSVSRRGNSNDRVYAERSTTKKMRREEDSPKTDGRCGSGRAGRCSGGGVPGVDGVTGVDGVPGVVTVPGGVVKYDGNGNDVLKYLEVALLNCGNCVYCYSIHGKRSGHYLSKCPLLKGGCSKCFQKNALKSHQDCPAMDSMPANLGICYFCGLEFQYHADGTFGKNTCRTWANDRLKSLGIIYWAIEEKYASLLEKPNCTRLDENGNLDYASFFNWFFDYDMETMKPNYYNYLLSIIQGIKRKAGK